jgi:hypothetical protein
VLPCASRTGFVCTGQLGHRAHWRFMKTHLLFATFSVFLLGGCANPLNRITSDRYAETCSIAEGNRNLSVAEEACYRALVNVDIGNLGPELKSQKLYNLGRVKRQSAKFWEAEQLFKESLSIEEKLSGPTDPKIGRRLVELSVSLAAQNKWSEGAQFLDRAFPTAEFFSGSERAYFAEILGMYAEQFRKENQLQLAERFESKAKSMK